jgi:RNA 2',3'-cyclic 3'-phosphodiesterase
VRLFIAVDLPPAVREALVAICTDLPGARWADPEQLHLTLRFMASVDDDRALREKLRSVRQSTFAIAVRGVGVFPRSSRKPPRVLWAGVTPHEPLQALKAAVDAEVDQVLGPDAEAARRGFSPHLTLARFSDRPGPALARFLTQHADFQIAPFSVAAFHLYQSFLGGERARHEVLETVTLG